MSTSSEFYFRASNTKGSLGAAAVRGGSWVLFSQATGTGVRAVSTIVLARLLLPADFGLYAMVIGVTSGLLIFKDLGLCDAVIQWPGLTDKQVSSLFWVNLGISIAVAACLSAAAPVLGWFYREPRVDGIVTLGSLSIVLGALSAQHLALLKRAMLFSGVSKLLMIAAIISNIFAVGLAWRGGGYWALVSRDVMNEAVTAIGAWLLCGWRPHKPSLHSGIKPMLVFGGHSMGSFIIRRTTRNLDRTLLGWKFGPVVTGYYHMAFELAAQFTGLITEPLRNVAVSSLSRLREQPQRFIQHYLKAVGGVAFASFAASAVLVAASADVVAIFGGPRWQPAAAILRVLGLSAGVTAIYMSNIWLHFSLGRADRMAGWTIVEAVVIAAAVIAGLPFGALGVARGYTLAMFFLCITGLWFAGRPVGLTIKETMASLWRPGLAAAIAAWLCWYVFLKEPFVQAHTARMIVFCASFGLLYGSFVIMLAGGIKTVRAYAPYFRQ